MSCGVSQGFYPIVTLLRDIILAVARAYYSTETVVFWYNVRNNRMDSNCVTEVKGYSSALTSSSPLICIIATTRVLPYLCALDKKAMLSVAHLKYAICVLTLNEKHLL